MSSTERLAERTNSTTDYEAALEEIAERGAAAIKNTKARIDDVVTDVADKGEEALKSARDVRDGTVDGILRSLRTHPYRTLAIAGLIGFAYGAMRRR
jgi:ElaB/YqjD/DUF883 family membrane-anchored ribosome-binding protein